MRFLYLIDSRSENLTDPSPACFMGIARQDLTSVSAEFINQIGLASRFSVKTKSSIGKLFFVKFAEHPKRFPV